MTSKGQHGTCAGKQTGLIGIAILLLAGFCLGQPAVSLSPKDGSPTTTLRVSGSGFTPYSQIDIFFDTQDQALVVTDATGAFSGIAIQAPASAVPGKHWVSVVERSGHRAKQEIFESHVNWTQFHTKNMKRRNPYENVLSVHNVGKLQGLWKYQTGDKIYASPAVVDGVVYIGSLDGNVYALDADSGAELWSSNVGVHESSVAVAGGVVYVGSMEDHGIHALSAKTGEQLATYPTGLWVQSSPAVVDRVVYVGSYDGSVYALNAHTHLLWTYQTGYFVYSSPAVDHGVVYIGSLDDNVYALDASTGTELWRYTTGDQIYSSPAVANGVVYIGSYDHNVYALNAQTGALLWRYATGWAIGSSPAVADGAVYIGSNDHKVYALDANTGALLWSFPTGAMEEGASPAVANGVVYFGSEDHNFYAVNARTGALLWKHKTGNLIVGSPAVVNGVVYIGSLDDNVYAFALPAGLAKSAPQRPNLRTLRPDLNLKVSTSQPVLAKLRAD